MGATQSHSRKGKKATKDYQLAQDYSIAAAVVANKRQRKLLLKQAKKYQLTKQATSLDSAYLSNESTRKHITHAPFVASNRGTFSKRPTGYDQERQLFAPPSAQSASDQLSYRTTTFLEEDDESESFQFDDYYEGDEDLPHDEDYTLHLFAKSCQECFECQQLQRRQSQPKSPINPHETTPMTHNNNKSELSLHSSADHPCVSSSASAGSSGSASASDFSRLQLQLRRRLPRREAGARQQQPLVVVESPQSTGLAQLSPSTLAAKSHKQQRELKRIHVRAMRAAKLARRAAGGRRGSGFHQGAAPFSAPAGAALPLEANGGALASARSATKLATAVSGPIERRSRPSLANNNNNNIAAANQNINHQTPNVEYLRSVENLHPIGPHQVAPHNFATNCKLQSAKRNKKLSQIMQNQQLQRGLALADSQRQKLGLAGLLPAAVQDQQLQSKAVINFLDKCPDELNKYIYLRNLKDFNEKLFYYTVTENVEKCMPIVYTPTVGLACQKFSEIYMRPRGLFVTANDAGRVKSLIANWPAKDVRVIVVTDGERILGLGDLGANGMGISIGKLSLYTALAGIPPENVLPVTIDVGTENEANLKDPFYIGLRQRRVRGQKYQELIAEFMQAVVARWGRSCLIQFEDFGNATAFDLLQVHREKYCCFNDDIQGTASVCLSGLISAAKLSGRRLRDCSFLFYGAGEANLGTAHLLTMAMAEEGLSSDEAHSRIWLVDSKGLVVESRTDLSHHKQVFARKNVAPIKDLIDIVDYTKPTAIIGASAQGGAFTEAICKKMCQINKEKPIIFALSNPTSRAECTAQQAYEWTDGNCVFASGSPFEPVVYKGRTYVTGQGNNAYIFPGVGLAAVAAHVHTIPEETFLVAAKALSDELTEQDTQVGLVYPSLTKIRQVTLTVAARVLEYFYSERLATYRPEPHDKRSFLKSIQYDYNYDDIDLGSLSLGNGNAKSENGKSLNGTANAKLATATNGN